MLWQNLKSVWSYVLNKYIFGNIRYFCLRRLGYSFVSDCATDGELFRYLGVADNGEILWMLKNLPSLSELGHWQPTFSAVLSIASKQIQAISAAWWTSTASKYVF
jgi:hypothetical protein